MKITSRNVNWIRAVAKKWFDERLQKDNPDILCIQETKAFENQMPAELKYTMRDYDYIRHTGERPWYAGTAIFYKKLLKVVSTKNIFDWLEEFSEHGRVTQVKFKDFTLLNIYFPNGWTRADWTEMLTYKLDFYTKFINYINWLRDNWENIITTWDFNICHKAIDIARPKENEKSIWFLPIEREKMSELESNWYTDVFRKTNPDLADHYTRRSYRAGARPRNVGRRLDYFRVSENIIPRIKKIEHQDQILGSDHCPISIELS
jgi:exodeoxyribonuclease-3